MALEMLVMVYSLVFEMGAGLTSLLKGWRALMLYNLKDAGHLVISVPMIGR